MLTAFFTIACAATSFSLAIQRSFASLAAWLAAVVSLGGVVWVGSRAVSNPTYFSYLIEVAQRHSSREVLAIAFGLSLAAPWFVLSIIAAIRSTNRDSHRSGERSWLHVLSQLLLAASSFGVAFTGGIFVWDLLYDIAGGSAVTVADANQLRIEELAKFENPPLRVAVDPTSSQIFVSFQFQELGGLGGGIYQLDAKSPLRSPADVRVVAQSPALFRAFGLAYYEGSLYVSRSGFAPRTKQGDISYEAQGAVTLLRDLDADGYYEYYDDLITDLPGVRGPDPLHQNYGLAVADDGTLYIANAHDFNRVLDAHPLAGAILCLRPGATEPTVYARGFRNPFGLAIGPNGSLLATDNDVEENPGDEVNHVIEGEHYGHPYYVQSDKNVVAKGFRSPIYAATHPQSNFTGLTFDRTGALPAPYRGTLLVCDFIRDQVLSLPLRPRGDTFEVGSPRVFAKIPSPIDIAAAPDGSVYVVSLYDKKLFRIQPKATPR